MSASTRGRSTTMAGGRGPPRHVPSATVASVDAQGALVARGALLDHRDRGVRRRGRAEQGGGDRGQVLQPHQHHQGAAQPGQRRPVDQRVRVPGGTCPETTVNSCATPAVGHRDAGRAPGTAIALVTPGTTVTGTPAAAQASTSSPPRPKTYGSPPLSRTTNLPGQRPVDQDPVDLLLRARPARRGSSRRRPARRRARSSSSSSPGASRSATTTSAAASSRRPLHGDQLRVARPAADQRHAGRGRRRAAPRATVGEAGGEQVADRVADGHRPARVAAAEHRRR